MPDIQRTNPEALAPPPGGRYSHVVRWGNLVWIAGQTSRGPDGKVIGLDNAPAQCRQVYGNLRTAIESVGGTFANIVKVTIFVTSEAYLPAARAAQNECWGDAPTPASSMVIVRALAQPEYFIEIEAFAVLDD